MTVTKQRGSARVAADFHKQCYQYSTLLVKEKLEGDWK